MHFHGQLHPRDNGQRDCRRAVGGTDPLAGRTAAEALLAAIGAEDKPLVDRDSDGRSLVETHRELFQYKFPE